MNGLFTNRHFANGCDHSPARKQDVSRAAQFDFGFPIRRTLRLCEIEEIMQHSMIIKPPPSRSYYLNKLEDGTLEGHRTEFGWVVYEDSFRNWVKNLQQKAA